MRLLVTLVLLSSLAAVPAGAQDDVEGPLIDHAPVKVTVSGKPVTIEATITDDNGVFEPAVLYRVGGEGAFLSLPMEPTGDTGVYAATIPGDIVVARLEYFIEAFDELGNGPTREGDPDLPMTVQVVAPSVAPAPEAPDAVKDPDAPNAPPSSSDEGGEAEEGSSLGLWLGVGGVAAGGVIAAAAVAAAGGAAAYYFLFAQGGGNTTPSQVTVVVSSPSPTGAALTSGAP